MPKCIKSDPENDEKGIRKTKLKKKCVRLVTPLPNSRNLTGFYPKFLQINDKFFRYKMIIAF
jgi:hypothetical protein